MAPEPEVELRPAHIRALLAVAETRGLTTFLRRAYDPAFLWPGFVFAEIPVILYRGSGEAFLVQHPDPPESFRPVRIPVPGLEEVPVAYHLGALEYLPAVGPVVVGGLDCATLPISVFRAAAAPESLVSALLHEAFHAFSRAFRPSGRSLGLLSRYPELSPMNNALGAIEARILHDYLVGGPEAPADAARVAYLFALVRRERRVPLDDEIIAYEQSLEAGEGVARYVEVRGLLAAAPGGASPAAGPLYVPGRAFEVLAGRRAYSRAGDILARRLARLNEVNRHAAGAAWWRFYHTGMAMALLADRVAPGWKRRVGEGTSLDVVIGERVAYDGGERDERELELLKQKYDYDRLLETERIFSRAERRRKEELLAGLLESSGTRLTFDVSALVAEETWWDSGRVSITWDPGAVDVVTSTVRVHRHGLRFRGFGTDLRFSGLPVVEDSKHRLFHLSVPSLDLSAEGDGRPVAISRPAEFEDGLEVALPGVEARAKSGYIRGADGTLYIKITC